MKFKSEDETYNWALEFAKELKVGDKVALYGNLGAGKTVISRSASKAQSVLRPTQFSTNTQTTRPFSTSTFTASKEAQTFTKSAWIRIILKAASASSNGPSD